MRDPLSESSTALTSWASENDQGFHAPVQVWRTTGQLRSNPGQVWPRSLNFGRVRAKFIPILEPPNSASPHKIGARSTCPRQSPSPERPLLARTSSDPRFGLRASDPAPPRGALTRADALNTPSALCAPSAAPREGDSRPPRSTRECGKPKMACPQRLDDAPKQGARPMIFTTRLAGVSAEARERALRVPPSPWRQPPSQRSHTGAQSIRPIFNGDACPMPPTLRRAGCGPDTDLLWASPWPASGRPWADKAKSTPCAGQRAGASPAGSKDTEARPARSAPQRAQLKAHPGSKAERHAPARKRM